MTLPRQLCIFLPRHGTLGTAQGMCTALILGKPVQGNQTENQDQFCAHEEALFMRLVINLTWLRGEILLIYCSGGSRTWAKGGCGFSSFGDSYLFTQNKGRGDRVPAGPFPRSATVLNIANWARMENKIRNKEIFSHSENDRKFTCKCVVLQLKIIYLLWTVSSQKNDGKILKICPLRDAF